MINNKILIPLLVVVIFLSFDTFSYALAIDNNCPLNVIHILQVTPALLCLEDRIDTLENQPVSVGSGEVNTASNLGSIGEGVFAQKVGVDLQFKKLVNGTNIILSSNGTRIMINATLPAGSGESNTASCDAYLNGQCIFAQKSGVDLQFKKILSLNDKLVISSNSSNILFNNTLTGESTVCNNLGSVGEGIYASGNCDFKKIQAGTGIVFSVNGTRITISASTQTSTLLNSSVHTDTVTQTPLTGRIIYADQNTKWNALNIGSDGKRLRVDGTINQPRWEYNNVTIITTSQQINDNMDIVICDPSGTDVIITLPVIPESGKEFMIINKDANNKCVIEGDTTDTINGVLNMTLQEQYDSITIFGQANDWLVISKIDVGQFIGDVYLSLTKTNIGVSYVDIYSTAFDEEELMLVDCERFEFGRIFYLWDYVGTGTQQLRWVNVADNTQVFYESPTFTSDRLSTDSGWFIKPTWCKSSVILEWQGKSTVGTDDPIAKGYNILAK